VWWWYARPLRAMMLVKYFTSHSTGRLLWLRASIACSSLSPSSASTAPTEVAPVGRVMSERHIEREVPIRPPDHGEWRLGDPLTPDMIRVRPDSKRRRAPNADLPDYVAE
jgi:hypothetical protein